MRTQALTIASLTIALAGCGSSSSSSSSGTSAAAYRARVNQICATYNAKIAALPANTGNTIPGLDKLLADAKSTLAQVKDVPAPHSMTSPVDKWLGSVEQSETNADQLVSAVTTGNKGEIQSLARTGANLNAQSNADAESLGLPSCALNAQPRGK